MTQSLYPVEVSESISLEALQELEKNYNKEIETGSVSYESKFNFAYGLIRSKYKDDMKRGIFLLQDLLRKAPEFRRECLYYLSLANLRLGNYEESRRFIDILLFEEPDNRQALSMQMAIDDKSRRDGMVGMAIAGSAAAAAIGIITAMIVKRGRR